ncbi:MAG: ABC transporter ATP-binding protein [Chromatiales bacterium]|jgi:iron(III) transport system ATP-binding protein|nr:ABC transporter ATP-binding protein [Chromatiales bacterium]MDX9767400.1 ABC transporter ATP-binding protein [Ectothiorhodospiraceae bacterium]
MTRLLDVQRVSVGYHGKDVVHSASFGLRKGTIGCLLGPSGCGKTTLLRAIAGFEPVSGGRIVLGDEEVSRPGWTLPPERRQVGMVFQDFALFPHLTVADNIGFGIRRWKGEAYAARVAELLEMVGLPQYGKAYPHALSGGQQQRIALARALAPRPRLMLLDEPFSSMDVELREGLAREVRGILKQENITAMLVTHDQMEAFAIADHIGVMRAGHIMQWDNAYNLYHKPSNRFVADFIGQGVILPGTVLNAREVETEMGLIPGKVPPGCTRGMGVDVLVRPDDIQHDDASPMIGEVVEKAFRGAQFLYTLRLSGGSKVLCLTPSHHDHPTGSRIGIRLDFDHLIVFPRDVCTVEPSAELPSGGAN